MHQIETGYLGISEGFLKTREFLFVAPYAFCKEYLFGDCDCHISIIVKKMCGKGREVGARRR